MSCLQLQLLNLDERIANLRKSPVWSVIDEKQKLKQQQNYDTTRFVNTTQNQQQQQPLVVNNLRRDRYDNIKK